MSLTFALFFAIDSHETISDRSLYGEPCILIQRSELVFRRDLLHGRFHLSGEVVERLMRRSRIALEPLSLASMPRH